MLKPYEMSRVVIAGPKKAQEDVIKELHRLKAIHIVEHSKTDLADIGEPLKNANSLSEMILKVRSLMAALNVKKEGNEPGPAASLLEISETANNLNEEVGKNVNELKKIDELLSKNSTISNELKILENINIPLEAFQPYRSLNCFTGYIDNIYDLNCIKDSLSKATGNFMIFDSITGKKIFIAAFIDSKHKEYLNNALQEIKFIPVKLISLDSEKLDKKENAANALKKVESQRARLEKLKSAINNQFERLAREYRSFLISAEEFLSQELEKSEAPLRFAATKDAFLIRGWIPTEQLNDAISSLNKSGRNKIFIHSEPAGDGNNVPVKLNNKQYSKPFEFFIDMYSMPKYKEIDPTFFIFLTFPIFFGFMLGDIGYGIVSFALFYFIRKKFPKASSLFNILLISSLTSILFGFVYGEFFGLEELFGREIPHLISRAHGITEMMYIAIAIGLIHLNWGLIAGFANLLKDHGLKHAIFEKGSWFVLEAGISLLVLSYMHIIPITSLIGWLFFAVSLIMLYKGEGIKGLIELPSILTNTLSYLRLMAIGLSSVSIAVVVNEISEGFFHESGFLIFAGILIVVIGHVLNLVLGLFGSFLHSLRLHYVEFFSKFFEGGAEKYSPFGARGQ